MYFNSCTLEIYFTSAVMGFSKSPSSSGGSKISGSSRGFKNLKQ